MTSEEKSEGDLEAVVRLASQAAERMWRIHPNDLDALGFMHTARGGKFKNPRAAYYASEILSVVDAALRTLSAPVAVLDGEWDRAIEAAANVAAECELIGPLTPGWADGAAGARRVILHAIRALSSSSAPKPGDET